MLVRSVVFFLIFIGVNSELEYPEEEYCPAVNICRTPLLYNVKYRCASDKGCRPQGYKCCRSDCYIHKVCVVPVNKNGEKIQLPDDVLEASTYVVTEPTEEITTTAAQRNTTEDFFSTTNTVSEITVDVTEPTDTITGTESSHDTEPIPLTESPIENITETLIPTGKEWQFEGSGDFGDEKDKVSSTTENLDDIEGSGNDEGIILFPDDVRVKNFTSITDDDFSFDNSVTVRDVDVVEGSGSGIGESDDEDVDEGVIIEKVWEGSGLDVIDNEPDDVDDETLTTYVPQIDDYGTTSKIYVSVNETHQNTTINEFIDIDYSYGSTLEELNSTLTSKVYENATFDLQENTTLQDLLNVSSSNPLTEEHQTETVLVEAINATTITHLTVKEVPVTESPLTYNTEETTANTSHYNISTYADVTTTTSLIESTLEDRNYSSENVTTNILKSENFSSTISASTENLNSSTVDANITTTKPITNEIVDEGSGDEFPDSESDDVDEEITTYVPIPLNKNYIRTKPNLTFKLPPDDGLKVTTSGDEDSDYDENEVDEDIRNNFQTRITSG